jgi:hypothetical protein
MTTRYATKKRATKKRATSKHVTKHKKKKKKQLPVCTAKDLKKSKKKRRKCRVVVATPHRPSPSGAVAAPPATSSAAGAWPAAAVDHSYDGLTVWDGTFDRAAATRLLFRAGFGPTPGQADQAVQIGLKGMVSALIAGGDGSLVGPAPSGDFLVGGQFAPNDVWGHGHLQWLDRMVRSNNPLQERMALVLHDWFATSMNGADLQSMSAQIDLFRRSALGSMRQLLQDVTVDHAMLQWLSGLGSNKSAPNENYGREVMELFTLGADRGAYTETDVRELARCLTGWRADWDNSVGLYNYRFDPVQHDQGSKTLFAGTSHQVSGNIGVSDAINAVVNHPLHPSFVVLKLWSYFIPTPPAAGTQAQLEALYRSSGEQLGPLVRAILVHPDLYAGPSMVKPPVVLCAGQLRARGRGIDTDAWTWICSNAGQLLWEPPNVSGWNDNAWLSTSTWSARWTMAQYTAGTAVSNSGYSTTETSDQAVASALAYWGNPEITAGLRSALGTVAAPNYARGNPYGNASNFNAVRQNTLRQMIAAAPDAQIC